MPSDVLIVGAGYAGAVSARKFAEAGRHVLVLESRAQVGGNAADLMDSSGVRMHLYGPHLFHTNSGRAVDFLSRFTDWYPYEQRVLGYVEGRLVPIPFNLRSIELVFPPEKADHLKRVLIDAYGMEKKVPILELRKNPDPEIKALAEFIFEHVFKYYTMKQWGYTVDQIDPAVTARVPVHVSYDDRYFQDQYQMMPKEGYTRMFERMLDHPNIEVLLNTDANRLLEADPDHGEIRFRGQRFDGPVIYTGIIDSLMNYQLGELSYRSLWFDLQTREGDFQPVTTVNYPTPAEEHPWTRITEYKRIMENPPKDRTTIAVEYPYAYDRRAEKGNVPYYPVFTEESRARYQSYVDLVRPIPNLHLLGRLAEYRYYNMDACVVAALDFCSRMLEETD